jgi:hypothetical protein
MVNANRSNWDPRVPVHLKSAFCDVTGFVQSDMLQLDLARQFDIVFASHGVMCWIPDIGAWGVGPRRGISLLGASCISSPGPPSSTSSMLMIRIFRGCV